MTTANLDLLKFGVQEAIGGDLMYTSVEMLEYMKDEIVGIFVSGVLLGEDAVKEYTFKYPADWWQAFRERWLPTWWLKNYPVTYTIRRVSIDVVYPELHKKIKFPKERHFYNIHVDIDEE